LGAHEVGRAVGRLLADADEDVVLIDASAQSCREAEDEGFRVVFGNALDERVLLIADVESRKAVIGTLVNEAVSLLWVRKARQEYKVQAAYVAIQRGHGSIDSDMISDAGAVVLFGDETDLELWSVRIRRQQAHVQLWRREQNTDDEAEQPLQLPREMQNSLLPLALKRDSSVTPASDRTRPAIGDGVFWLVMADREKDWRPWLESRGWRAVEIPSDDDSGTSEPHTDVK
jgi:hypothetical protein